MYLENSKRFIIWNGGSSKLSYSTSQLHIFGVGCQHDLTFGV